MKLKATLLFVFSFLFFFFSFHVAAQVSSASISGVVKDESKKPMEGAIVEAIHVPSGTKYGTDTKKDGSFNIQGMRVGGPYTINISFGGAVIRTFENVNLQLGEVYQLDVQLGGDHQLTGVTVTSSRDNVFNTQHTGASTFVSEEEINTLPTIGRNAFDFVALTPQSTISSGYGTSIEGRNTLFNNVQINGGNFNNSFGLGDGGFSGDGMPLPLDAVQQIQTVISDYDIRQNGFTGGNINLVTRSGNNTLQGDAYTYYRDQNFNGTHVGNADISNPGTHNVYGASLGGPIIKNKLFFFVSGEYEQSLAPALSPYWVASTPGETGPTVSNVSADSLQEISNYVKNKFGYNTGPYPGGPGFNNTFLTRYVRFLARLDYNINNKNKLSVSFNHYDAHEPENDNSTSAATGSITNGRNSVNALSFANTEYNYVDKVNALTAELNTTLSSNISNQLLCSYNQTRDTRSSPSSDFPFVDINAGNNEPSTDNYASLGYELFTYNNDVKQNSLTLFDNLTIHAGVNNITAGVSYQLLTFADSYLPYGTTYYRYGSIQDFVTNQAPIAFGYTYAYQGQDGYARMNYGLPGIYVQDKISLLNNRLMLTGGVRADMPLYLNSIPYNKYIDTLNLANPDAAYNNGYGTAYHTTHYDASRWPTEHVIISPRFSFNWSPLDNRKLQIRGGSGIYLGQIPFVWFTNAPANSGVVSNNVQLASGLQNMQFQPDPKQAIAELPASSFPQQGGSSVPGLIAAIDPNFKMPEVWRSDLGADYKLPWLGMIGTVELVYTHDIYDDYEFNANQPNPIGNLQDSNDHRPIYPGGQLYSTSPNISGAYILSNSRPGYSYSGTLGVRIPTRKGLYGSLNYTRMYSAEASSVPGSQASSAWEGLDHLNSPNENILSNSEYYVPNRYVGTLSYRYQYAKHFASTLSFLYLGQNGQRFDWTYYSDINGDGIYGQLMYIPHNASELNWQSIRNSTTGALIFSAAQEEAAFNAFVNQDKYLNSHRGQYAQRYGEAEPFYGKLSLKFIQDLIGNIGKNHNSIQISLDVVNLPNLLNRNWGLVKYKDIPYGSLLIGNTVNGKTTYKMTTVTETDSHGNTITYNTPVPGNPAEGTAPDGTTGPLGGAEVFLPTSTFTNNIGTNSVWQMQLGLKYNFK